jgi:hypothetical protein
MSKIKPSKNTKKQPDSADKLIRSKCYAGIDEFPVWNWFEIFKGGNLFHLLRVKKAIPKKQIPILKKIFTELYDAYLKEFGLNETMQEIIELKKNIIQNTDKYIQGDMGAFTFIQIDEDRLQELQEKTGGENNIWELKARMEVTLKINIDVKKCTVIEFYSYLKIISEMQNKAA